MMKINEKVVYVIVGVLLLGILINSIPKEGGLQAIFIGCPDGYKLVEGTQRLCTYVGEQQVEAQQPTVSTTNITLAATCLVLLGMLIQQKRKNKL